MKAIRTIAQLVEMLALLLALAVMWSAESWRLRKEQF